MGPGGTKFIATPIIIFDINKTKKILQTAGMFFPYPVVIRMEMTSASSIEIMSGNHVT
jgi:hypothetical protein